MVKIKNFLPKIALCFLASKFSFFTFFKIFSHFLFLHLLIYFVNDFQQFRLKNVAAMAAFSGLGDFLGFPVYLNLGDEHMSPTVDQLWCLNHIFWSIQADILNTGICILTCPRPRGGGGNWKNRIISRKSQGWYHFWNIVPLLYV